MSQLFNRVRREFTATGNQANVDPHTWRLPSSYSPSKPGGKQTVIPNPRIFANAFIPSEPKAGGLETALDYPDVSHAAVHLALLECFRNLRLSASTLDVEVNRPPAYEEKAHTTAAPPTCLPKSQRWNLLIDLAVARFAAWWSNINDVLNHAAAYAHHASDKVAVQLGENYLPPLDVLLVWYAFMLDTDAYRAACRDREPQVPRVQQLCFPWPAIRDIIDMEKMEFTLPNAAQTLFTTLSGQSVDILTYLKNPPAYADPGAVPFEIDLAAEVKKHEKFIDEAHRLLWIRAPAFNGSLARASVNYLDFQLKGAAAKKSGGDPPFGIELLWRTHRLFPNQYELFLQGIGDGGQGGDSKDPTLQSLTSGSGAANPNIVSEHCYCWTCERIRDDIPIFVHTPPPYASSSASSSSSSSSSAAPSAAMQSQLSSILPVQLRQIQDDLGFYSAVESARRRPGEPLPTRPPTAAEKEAERIAKEKQKEVGYLPGPNEYVEVLPDGRQKIRRQKNASLFSSKWAI